MGRLVNLFRIVKYHPNAFKEEFKGQLASSVNTQYHDHSAVIGSNLDYAAIHQLGGKAGRNKKVEIPARPYLKLTDDDFEEILQQITLYLK